MGTNQAENYDGYAHPAKEGLYLELKDEVLSSYAEGISVPRDSQEIQYVKENEEAVPIPETLPENIASHEIWKEYSGRCIGCGRCNFVCPTCTCFTMQISFTGIMKKPENGGESGPSCQVDGYSDIAGGISFRKDQGERMRFKVLHKIQNYKNRLAILCA